ncbi:gram-negative bacteria binding protein 1 [Haematobia irritans]
MVKEAYRFAFVIVNVIQFALFVSCFNVEQVKFELLDEKFRLSIPNDPDIKWVGFNVNINREFRSFEAGQLSGLVGMPRDRVWSYEFERSLKDTDLVYVWLAVQYNNVIFRDKQGPISVGAVRTGNPHYVIPTSTTTSTTTTTTTRKPTTAIFGSNPNKDGKDTSGKECYASVTVVQKNAKRICKGDLIFEDHFDQFNTERWTNEVYIPINSGDSEFVLYNATAFVDDSGVLEIPAQLYEGKINRGVIDLGQRCTKNNDNNCHLIARTNWYLPPIISGRISSENSFNFKYGRIEVKAKLPKGDWLVPLILLEPHLNKYGSDYYRNGEIRIAFSRGNNDLQLDDMDIGGKRLFGGVVLSRIAENRHDFMVNVTLNDVDGSSEHFGDKFHLYSLIWKPDELLFSIDGYTYGKIQTNFKRILNDNDHQNWKIGDDDAPLDQMFFLTLGLSAGGHGDFPQHVMKPWQNTSPKATLKFNENRLDWSTSWQDPSLKVDYVRVYAV